MLAVAQSGLAAINLTATIVLLLTVGEIWTAALATLVVEALGTVLVLPLLARRRGVSFREISAAWVLPVAAGCLAALPTLVLARAVTDTDSLLILAVVGAAWSAAFAAIAWRLALTDNERAIVRGLVGRRRTRSLP